MTGKTERARGRGSPGSGSRGRRLVRRVGSALRAPFRLLRFPGVLVAVFGAGLVLAVAGASAPLFVSAGGGAALADRIGTTSTDFAGLRLSANSPISPDRLQFRQQLVGVALQGLPFDRATTTVIGSVAQVNVPGQARTAQVQMITREGFEPWITRVSGGGSNGYWVPRTVATALKIKPGQRVEIQIGLARTSFRVAGVYRDLVLGPLPSFWIPLNSRIFPRNGDPAEPIPPPFLLGDLEPFTQLEGRLRDQGTLEFDAPLTAQLTLEEARQAAAGTTRVKAATYDATSPLNAAFDTIDSGLPALVQLANQTVAATTQPVQAISLAGRLVALVLVIVAGVYGVRRRQVEIELLSARGVGPFRLGVRTAVESVLPAALGAAAGWALALFLVHTIGPSAATDPGAIRSSIIQVAVSVAVGVALFGLAAGGASRNEARERPGRLRDAASRWPWEVAALALAGASLYEILNRGTGSTGPNGAPPKFDLLILLFPFLFVAGTAGLLVRWLRRQLPRLKAAGSKRGPWLYLSASRLASAPRLATSLVTASALAIGILTYAGVLAQSIESTATEKATLSIGADVVVQVGALASLEHPPFAWTPIQRFPTLDVLPGTGQAELIAVDPDSFAGTAFWSSRLGPSLQDLTSKLPAATGPLRVIVAGPLPPPGLKIDVEGQDVPVSVVQHVTYFPGATRGKLTLVADRAAVVRTFPSELAGLDNSYELWAKGDSDTILPYLARQQFAVDFATTADHVRTTPAFLALSWTFGLLESFGALAGLIAILGMVLYLQARQQSREVSYALARRMGLKRREHRRSVLAELLAMLLGAFVLGALFSSVAAALVHGKLDPIPNLPPGPFLELPSLLFAATALGLIVSCALGARLVQRRADNVNVAEVMRRAG